MQSSIFRSVCFSLFVLGGISAYTQESLAAQSKSAPQPAALITEPINEARQTVLAGNVHPLAVAANDRGEAPLSTSTGRIQLVLRRSAAQQQALVQYLADMQNPHSPSYRKWLTPAQFGAAYGVADTDLQTVKQWLEGHGFKVEHVSPARNVIQFSGNFGQIKSTFHTSIHNFQVNSVQHYANVSDPQIPAALKPVIASIGPLHDFRPVSQAKFGSTGHYDPASHTITPDLTLFSNNGTPYLYVDPADAATIYNTPNALLNKNYSGTTYDGTGVNIGVAGDSNITMQDVTNYRVAFLGESTASANTPTVVVDGQDPLVNGDAVEALLDTEISGGIAPKAKVYLYTAASTDLQTGLFLGIFRALDDNTVSILNISFGECEAYLGAAGNQLMLEIMTQAAAQGISVTVSTGDSGSAGCDRDNSEAASYGLNVNGIASTPYNIAVGGTDFDVLASGFSIYVTDNTDGTAPYYDTALSYIPEQPWNDSTYSSTDIASNFAYSNNGVTDIVGGGGGASSCSTSTTSSSGAITCESGYTKPPFQSALTPTDGVRDLPDVAFLAANGFFGATWVVCSDNISNGVAAPTYTNCETTNGAFTSGTSFSGFGGTSAAAPAMAGILALVEQKTGSRLGQADYVLYQSASSKYATVFHDITQGDNSVVCNSGTPNCGSNGFLTGYDAATGYDQASGLGSIDVAQLVSNWDTAGLTATSTTLTINGSTTGVSVPHGTSLTFGVGVSPSAATGVVGIVDTANENGSGAKNNGQTSIALSGGSGSVVYNGLPGGTYTVSAFYSGDAADAASTSTPVIPVTITPEASTTALALNVYSAAGSNPAITDLSSVPYGSYYLADVQIYGTAEGTSTEGIATGSISFSDNGSALTSGVPINSANQAFYETPTTAYPTVFSVGSHSVSASYAGDASYNASSSTATAFTVVQGATTVTVAPASASIDSLAADQVVVTVSTSSVGNYPTGTIVLTANGVTLATVSSGYQVGFSGNGGVAISTTLSVQGSVLSAGANTIAATYSGDGNYTGSNGLATITVAEAGFALKNSGAITVADGATSGNTSSITVTPSNGFLGVINLSCAVTTSPSGAGALPTCAIASTANITGTASVSTALTVNTTSGTDAGAYAVTVTGTDANTGKITAATVVSVTVTGGTVVAGSFALTNSGAITVSPGAASGNTATITMTPANGFTGAVNLSCAVTTSITSPSDLPTCTIPASVNISGSAASTATLTVTTTGSSSARNETQGSPFTKAGGAALAGLLLLMLPVRRRRYARLLGVVVLAVSLAAAGCGGASGGTTTTGNSGTTAGTYTVTVTGVDAATGKITASTAVRVVVN
jgi:hypothetical protein